MNTRHATILTALSLSLLLGSCASSERAQADVTLVYYSAADLQSAEFNHPVTVTRRVETDNVTPAMDTILRELFAGPNLEEQQAGAVTSEDLRALGPLFLGSSIDGNGVVTVNFTSNALPILNAAAARQFMVKSPIEATLRKLPVVREVKYAIDGKVFEEWDA
jgi:hypothetical protein